MLELRKPESGGNGLKLTRKESYGRRRGMWNARRRIAGRMFAFPSRKDRDRAFVIWSERLMEILVKSGRMRKSKREKKSAQDS